MQDNLKIGISMRIMNETTYIESRDALSHDWSSLLEELEFIPVFIPNSLSDVSKFLEKMDLDGIILSGGDSMGNFPLRDQNENKILQYAISKKIPLLGVCRGMQLLNLFFNGTIETNSTESHVGSPHIISLFGSFKNLSDLKSTHVNSFHKNLIKKIILEMI